MAETSGAAVAIEAPANRSFTDKLLDGIERAGNKVPHPVMIFVYLSTPQYISLLWTTDMGRLMLAGCLFWMFTGVMVMRKMINFDF